MIHAATVGAVLVLGLAGAGASASPVAGQHESALAVGTAVGRPGETTYGEIRVPPGTDAGVAVPVAVVCGGRPGPVVAVVAGFHGTEYASTVALARLIARIEPRALAGTLIVVPLLNPSSFEQMAPHAGLVPLPGDPAGPQAPRLAAAVADEVVRPASVVIDIHGGDLDEDARPHSFWLRGGNIAQDEASRRLVLAFGLSHVVVWDVDLGDTEGIGRSVPGYAMSLGKAAFAAAVGGMGLATPTDAAMIEDGVLGVLGSLGMMARAPAPVERPVWLGGRKRVNADGPGMFYAEVAPGSYVSTGMRVGRTTDYLGRSTGVVRAPDSGVVLYVRGVPSMWPGATLIMVGPVITEVPPYVKPTR